LVFVLNDPRQQLVYKLQFARVFHQVFAILIEAAFLDTIEDVGVQTGFSKLHQHIFPNTLLMITVIVKGMLLE
jgi:hypothetical protein